MWFFSIDAPYEAMWCLLNPWLLVNIARLLVKISSYSSRQSIYPERAFENDLIVSNKQEQNTYLPFIFDNIYKASILVWRTLKLCYVKKPGGELKQGNKDE